MKTIAFYDDRLRLDDEARAFIGVDRFSRIRSRKRTLGEHARLLLAAAGPVEVVDIADADDVAGALRVLQAGEQPTRVVIWPSAVTFKDPAAATIVLAKMRWIDEPFRIAPWRQDGPTLMFLDPASARKVLARPPWLDPEAPPIPGLQTLPDQAGMIDLTERDRLFDLLAGTFDARHFNSISHDGQLVTKRSTDIAKMQREHDFYSHLATAAGPLRLFFLEPLAFRRGPDWAEYDSERIGAPDAAIQWIHGAFDPPGMTRFLGKLGEFLLRRPLRSANAGREAAERLYLGKVAERQRQLRALPAWATVSGMLDRIGAGGLDAITARFERQWRRHADRRKSWDEAISHGDLCLSNILYCRQSRLMKFIDPRGATQAADLWMDANYDLAKLSHSLLGDYDFINHDLCDLELDQDLGLHLCIDGPERSAHQAAFIDLLNRLGRDPDFVRACEASLFLSMLPLHADVPKKVVAFVLQAERIVGRLEQA